MDAALETRHLHGVTVETRAGSFRPTLRGYALVFDEWSDDLGGFRERIAPAAVRRTFDEEVDVRALAHHDPARVLGRVTARTLRLSQDAHGLAVEIDPPDTSDGRDIVESVRRGDLSGMSFAFRMLDETWNLDGDLPERTITDARIHEVSVVAFPAYPQTDVATRSLHIQQSLRISLEIQRRRLALERTMLQ